jgi:hypothetical protein
MDRLCNLLYFRRGGWDRYRPGTCVLALEETALKLICIMPVRNEAWVLGMTARAVLQWCDELVILDHASTDNSRAIAADVEAEFPERVSILIENDPTWREMAHRQRLLEFARRRGATRIALVDADEILTANLVSGIRGLIEQFPAHAVLQIPWLALRGSINRVHVSGPWAHGQNVSTAFKDAPDLHWTSATRGGYDFHHRHPMGRPLIPSCPIPNRHQGLMHLQFVSGRRLRAKQYLYQLTERLRWPDREPVGAVRRRYSLSVYGSHEPQPLQCLEATLGQELHAEWWGAYAGLQQYFDPHAEPWQLAECEQVLKANPGIEVGLDDFGLFSEPFYERG